ncbi:MAG: hypothetical protein HQL20_05520 [Candidatus Omnitrophica bacterium]|nr:hypothetical protein [Candidatus Omnitrophota bacterium]
MVQFLAVVFGLILVAVPVMAQVYNGRAEVIVAPMDNAIATANAYYANVANPGAVEESQPQDVRYNEMTNAMDEANQRHFQVVVNGLK